MKFSELAVRFIAGGSLVVAVSLFAKAKNPVLAGLFMLFPVITLVGFYFIGSAADSAGLRKIALFSMAALPATLVFLASFYVLIGSMALRPCLLLSTLAWCAAAAVVLLINHFILRIGF
ncbi:MAG TPA: GlpM family protein [Chitinivibrionales bacterium]|nr:GlpM family protein [Chitinivibrionales bacterium]